ncbi:hypothetical protein C7S20_14535 [Christiangramia fulva]|uniref:ScyD/ScyE family protein n=1 Tax=Christiangramia fulva TaxID=2126553 RepID=A0A2R3Z834_9FLAO|nr:ScyD/ScyE family protein [Christiangramia fulva]AVR46382.1 hypothetical protein C7S20_14535 [Christiangramia fulva]
MNAKKQPINYEVWRKFLLILLIVFAVSCQKETEDLSIDAQSLKAKKNQVNAPFEFTGVVYDISATPDGSIMVGVNSGTARSIQLIKKGEVRTMQEVQVNTDIQGIQAIGTGNAFFTTGGSDLAEDGELYRVSNGNVRMVADLGKFEKDNDPDAYEGIQWKDQECESDPPDFHAGAQNNPFKVTALDGKTALVADAAGNTVLQATTTGEIDWKVLLTPPLNESGDFKILSENEDLTCYVQPVATSVAVGQDEYFYVGELTGAIPDGFPTGLSRVWKIRKDATHVVCNEKVTSNDYELLVNGLTSIIDLEVGPDGLLYVVEYDKGSWFASFLPDFIQGGRISAYNTESGELIKEVSGLEFPSAITFDKKGDLWLLEKNVMAPSVRMLDPDEWEWL